MEKAVFNHWHGNNLEREVFPRLLEMGQLYTYCHDGFFKSMDTYKDQQELEEMLAGQGRGASGDLARSSKHYRYFDHHELKAEPA